MRSLSKTNLLTNNPMQKKTGLPALLFLFYAFSSFGKITLPALVGDHMVLQQQSEVALWGKAKASTPVTVITSWNNQKYSVKSTPEGTWKVLVKTPAAGGPYEISLSDGEKRTLTDILIGEVWVCSGQSNMTMPMKGFKNQPIKNSNTQLLEANNPQLRLFTVARHAIRTPQDTCRGQWEVSTPATAQNFSALGYQYARLLQQSLQVPVGMIHTSWGGTPIEAWMSVGSLGTFPEVKIIPASDTSAIKPSNPGVLYNGMIQPLLNYGIRGFIWYQGEANCAGYAQYTDKMAAMIKDWRARWGRGELPFYFVQLAPYTYPKGQHLSAYLREAQLKAMRTIPQTGMAVSLDMGEEKLIHPADKSVLSQRLAYWALTQTYGWKGLAFSGPAYRDMRVQGDRIQLLFDYAENGLTSFGKPFSAFEIAGADRVFYPAEATVNADGIVVRSEKVPQPVAVRYAFKDWVVGDLYNVEGLPASSFRTDSWEE